MTPVFKIRYLWEKVLVPSEIASLEEHYRVQDELWSGVEQTLFWSELSVIGVGD